MQLSVFLIEIVVVNHGAGVAVKIQHKVVHDKVTDHRIDVNDLRDVFALTELFQGLDQPTFVL